MFKTLSYLGQLERNIEKWLPDTALSKRDQLAIAAEVEPQPWDEFARSTLIRSGLEFISFEPFPYQRRVIELIGRYRGAVIVKTRQLGITEAIASRMLQKATENPAYAGAVFSKTGEDTANVAKRTSMMAATGQVRLKIDNTERIQPDNGAQVFYRTSNKDAGRGLESIHDLFFDEAAFPQDIEKLYGAASPSQSMVGSDASTIIVSTPNGKSGFFWRMLQQGNPEKTDVVQICKDVRDGELYSDGIPGFYYFVTETNWVKIFIHYTAHPIYGSDPNYLARVQDELQIDNETLQREFNLTFEDGSNQVFRTDHVDNALCGRWLPAYPNRRYILAVDCALGGQNYFCAGILDVTEPQAKLVAWFRDNYKTSDYYILKTLELWDDYRPKETVVETNNGGQIYIDDFILNRPSGIFEGVYTGPRSKPVHIGRLNLLLERTMLALPPEPIIRDEFRNFQRNADGSMGGANGFNDDIVLMLSVGGTKIDLNRKKTNLPPRQRRSNVPTAADIFG
jgi:hypothetical protein